jgi:hypothetical protein
MTTDDDRRIRYLTGEDGQSLSPSERAKLDQMTAALREPALWAEPPAGLEDAVVAAIAAEARGSTPVRPARRHSWRRRLVRPRARLGIIALAATGLAVAVIVIGKQSTGPAPEQFAMVVTGTQLAPYAHGRAVATKMESGWQFKLSATGLPRLAGGRYYEAWLKNAAGTLVPIGTFNDARQVTLWSGVTVTQFRTLTVTAQRAGNPAPSGLRVLVGTIRRAR